MRIKRIAEGQYRAEYDVAADFPTPILIAGRLDEIGLELVNYEGAAMNPLLAEASLASEKAIEKVYSTYEATFRLPWAETDGWQEIGAIGARFDFPTTDWLNFARTFRLMQWQGPARIDRFYYAAYLFQVLEGQWRYGLWFSKLFDATMVLGKPLFLSREQALNFRRAVDQLTGPGGGGGGVIQVTALFGQIFDRFQAEEVTALSGRNYSLDLLNYITNIATKAAPEDSLAEVEALADAIPREVLEALIA